MGPIFDARGIKIYEIPTLVQLQPLHFQFLTDLKKSIKNLGIIRCEIKKKFLNDKSSWQRRALAFQDEFLSHQV